MDPTSLLDQLQGAGFPDLPKVSPDRELIQPRPSWHPARYLPHMERAVILSSLAASGTGTARQRLTELAAELDIPAADILVVAGHPVPVELLPPERDATVMRKLAYRVSYCDHSQLAALEAFIRSLPRVAAPEPFVQPAWPGRRPAETRFAAVLGALLRNRGFGIRELPFLGLSLSTLHGMVWRWDPSPHRRQQLSAVAGPLGWTLPDLFAVADERYSGHSARCCTATTSGGSSRWPSP